MPNVAVMARTTVFGCYDQTVAGAIERVGDHLAAPPDHHARQRYWTIRAKRIVLACGADERLIAFPGNDRPGVMLSGAARTFAARYGALAGRRAVLFANNDDGKYKKQVYTLPKHLDEKVARLHLAKIGAKLTQMNNKQATYINVPKDGPYKPDHYRY